MNTAFAILIPVLLLAFGAMHWIGRVRRLERGRA
jgi:hypothetical protein